MNITVFNNQYFSYYSLCLEFFLTDNGDTFISDCGVYPWLTMNFHSSYFFPCGSNPVNVGRLLLGLFFLSSLWNPFATHCCCNQVCYEWFHTYVHASSNFISIKYSFCEIISQLVQCCHLKWRVAGSPFPAQSSLSVLACLAIFNFTKSRSRFSYLLWQRFVIENSYENGSTIRREWRNHSNLYWTCRQLIFT